MDSNHYFYLAFDLNGVLFQEGHYISKTLMDVIRSKNLPLAYETIKKIYLEYEQSFVNEAAFHALIPAAVEQEFLDRLTLHADCLSTLGTLKQKGLKLGVISNMPTFWGQYLLDKHSLPNYLDPIVLSGQERTAKPDQTIYQIFLKKTGSAPANCYFVDDKQENLVGARQVGMRTIWFKSMDNQSFSPDYTIEKLSDLLNIF